jgi:dihydroxyacetone kinase-like predicted kinase
LITPERELLTIITGDGASANMTDELVAHVGQAHPHISCEVHFGGQPLYPYLFGVE